MSPGQELFNCVSPRFPTEWFKLGDELRAQWESGAAAFRQLLLHQLAERDRRIAELEEEIQRIKNMPWLKPRMRPSCNHEKKYAVADAVSGDYHYCPDCARIVSNR